MPTDAGGTSGGRFHCAAAARRPHAPVWKRTHQPEGWPFIYQISDQGTFTFQNTRFPEILKKFPYLLAGWGVISLSTFFHLLCPSVPHCPVSACAIRGRGPGPGVAGTVGRIAIHGYAGQGACQSIIPGTIHTEVSIIMLAWSGTYRPLYHTRSVHTTHPESSYRGVLYDAVRCSPAGHIYSMA